MKGRTLEQSVRRIQARLAHKFPGLEMEVEFASPKEATIYYYTDESEDSGDVVHSISGLAVDTLVDYGHWIHVQPKFRQPATP